MDEYITENVCESNQDMYKKLSAPLSSEAIEKAPKEITRKGYDTIGYQYQYIVERLNEICGLSGWSFAYSIIKEIEGQWKQGKKYYDITVEVKITINKINTHCCIGGHRADNYCDALKGAITNGFKKTAAFFGIGQDAYKGIIDEDYRSSNKIDKNNQDNDKENNNNMAFMKEIKKELLRIGKDNKFFNEKKVAEVFGLKTILEAETLNRQQQVDLWQFLHFLPSSVSIKKGLDELCEDILTFSVEELIHVLSKFHHTKNISETSTEMLGFIYDEIKKIRSI